MTNMFQQPGPQSGDAPLPGNTVNARTRTLAAAGALRVMTPQEAKLAKSTPKFMRTKRTIFG